MGSPASLVTHEWEFVLGPLCFEAPLCLPSPDSQGSWGKQRSSNSRCRDAHRLLGNWDSSPQQKALFVLKLSNLPQGLFQAEECVILRFCELTELPLTQETGEMDPR